MVRPGPKNLITDVRGITVGNAEDATAMTGVTVLFAGGRGVGAADIRGGAPGTRETEALLPEGLNVGVDAIVLAGGSVYGLDAAGAVTNWLAQIGARVSAGGCADGGADRAGRDPFDRPTVATRIGARSRPFRACDQGV
jgi:L-aminopeptidase/D-esterase-like protein